MAHKTPQTKPEDFRGISPNVMYDIKYVSQSDIAKHWMGAKLDGTSFQRLHPLDRNYLASFLLMAMRAPQVLQTINFMKLLSVGSWRDKPGK